MDPPDETGFLRASTSLPKKEGSKTFTQMVDQLIHAEKKTVIGLDDEVLKMDEDGKPYKEDVFGVTVGTKGTDQVIVINPSASRMLGEKETAGLLAHEMAHAIDGINGTKTNDPSKNEEFALGEENKVREELGLEFREFDTKNAVGDAVYSPVAPIIALAIATAGVMIRVAIVRIGSRYAIKVGSTLFYAVSHKVAQRALASTNSVRYGFGNTKILLSKSSLQHILIRHHPKYWNSSKSNPQTFFDPRMSIKDVRNYIVKILHHNRASLKTIGEQELVNKINGIRYKLIIDKGAVKTFFPLP